MSLWTLLLIDKQSFQLILDFEIMNTHSIIWDISLIFLKTWTLTWIIPDLFVISLLFSASLKVVLLR